MAVEKIARTSFVSRVAPKVAKAVGATAGMLALGYVGQCLGVGHDGYSPISLAEASAVGIGAGIVKNNTQTWLYFTAALSLVSGNISFAFLLTALASARNTTMKGAG